MLMSPKYLGGSPLNKFRQRRFGVILSLIDTALAMYGSCRIIDLGGRFRYWEPFLDAIGGRPVAVTILNLEEFSDPITDPRFRHVQGNACSVEAADNSFDIAHSNSVLEHLGSWASMAAMARETRRLAPMYYCQTPYYWFPIEPHARALLFHWLPDRFRLFRHMHRQLGFYSRAETPADGMMKVHDAHLLSAWEMKILFPDAEIVRERIGPLTKSLMAIRTKP